LRLAWARRQLAAGRTVWSTPEILTWDAWLARQWRSAVQRGAQPAAQLLAAGQERALWEEALRLVAAAAGDEALLAVHANGLGRAAARATQSLLVLTRSAINDEERLLVATLAEVRGLCAERNLISLRLASTEALQFLATVPAPAIAGQQRLTPLQQALQRQHWPDAELLLPAPQHAPIVPALRRFANLDAELRACAAWCLAALRQDPQARLLVLSACGEPALNTQAALLWRELAADRSADEDLRRSLLAVEGGEVLRHQALIDDALTALEFTAREVDTRHLFALLRSPYLQFGTQAERWKLQGWFEMRGLARWTTTDLRAALEFAAAKEPAARSMLTWLDELQRQVGAQASRSATDWAQRFSDALKAAGFAAGQTLDSREQQRLLRWHTLLDELAGLDAVLAPMRVDAALQRLQQLASEARHQAASGDAAITLSDALIDPVVDYQGIWVLGLAESRWPAPPRPDPYVALAEQRRGQWEDSGVSERRAQASWALSCWQRRTSQLVLSYAEREGDIHHRPTALPGGAAAEWLPDEDAPATAGITGRALPARDQQFPPIPAGAQVAPLPGGERRLTLQRDCPFRAHAEFRLAARAPLPLADGITPLMRGKLLHTMLESLWRELRDQAALLALAPEAEAGLLQRHWREAVQRQAGEAGSTWLGEGLLARERGRTLRVVRTVLELERQRAPFTVQATERAVEWPQQGARLRLRIDRIDRAADGARLLLDYKTGAADRMKLHDSELDPLQLALYVTALAGQGESVAAAFLLDLRPGRVQYTGVAASAAGMPSLKEIPDWSATAAAWRAQLLQLLQEHLHGDAPLASATATCRHCHLPALCRRAADEDAESDDE
jgi:probable DNA repair protein